MKTALWVRVPWRPQHPGPRVRVSPACPCPRVGKSLRSVLFLSPLPFRPALLTLDVCWSPRPVLPLYTPRSFGSGRPHPSSALSASNNRPEPISCDLPNTLRGYPLTMASLRLTTRGLLRMRTAAAARPLSSHAMAAEEARPAVTMLDEEEVMVRFYSARESRPAVTPEPRYLWCCARHHRYSHRPRPFHTRHLLPQPSNSTIHRSRSLASPIRSHCTRTHTHHLPPRNPRRPISPAAAPPPHRSSKTARGASRPR